jgi:hypothetical protein
MVIIGVDYHPSDQYIAFVDTETHVCRILRIRPKTTPISGLSIRNLNAISGNGTPRSEPISRDFPLSLRARPCLKTLSGRLGWCLAKRSCGRLRSSELGERLQSCAHLRW